MSLINKIGIPGTGISTHVVDNLQILTTETKALQKRENLPKASSENYDQYYTDIETKIPPSDTSRSFRKFIKFINNITSMGVVGGSVLLYWLFQAPGTYKALNKTNQLFNNVPTAATVTIPNNSTNNLHGVPIDSFVSNYRNFKNIHKAILDTNINTHALDLNKNNIILDVKEEIEGLIAHFKSIDENRFKEEIKLLEEINITSQLIWGRNGPDIYITQDRSNPNNCEVIATIQGHFATSENIQNIKGRIRVLNFNPSPNNLRIDTIVELSNQNIYIPFEVLDSWMTSKQYSQPRFKDNPLSIPLLVYAVEKGLEKYGGIPNPSPSAPPTLLSGREHCYIPTATLSDNELINLLSKAPHSPTQLGSADTIPIESTTVNIFRDGINHWIKSANPTNLSHASTPFIQTLISNLENIKSRANDHIDHQNYLSLKSLPGEVVPKHMYTVKDFKKVGSEYITTIVSNNAEHELTLNEVRKYMDTIVTESENIPNLGKKGLEMMLWSLITLFVINKARISCNKIILPDENKIKIEPKVSNS